jgi:small subunit ribosomal protein S6
MFLTDNTKAKEDVDGVLAELGEIVVRAGGEVVNIGKWDERKLTFQIKRQRRGTYVLCHWNGPADAPTKLERSCSLSETVLRVLTLRDEDGTEIKSPREESYARREGRRY